MEELPILPDGWYWDVKHIGLCQLELLQLRQERWYGSTCWASVATNLYGNSHAKAAADILAGFERRAAWQRCASAV